MTENYIFRTAKEIDTSQINKIKTNFKLTKISRMKHLRDMETRIKNSYFETVRFEWSFKR